MTNVVRLSAKELHEFDGHCLASVVALNHDDSVRRSFRLFKTASGYVAERIDGPDTIDIRHWGAICSDVFDVYDFFGNEPLANYLYGHLGLTVPGLKVMS